jgi:hypothetical protein
MDDLQRALPQCTISGVGTLIADFDQLEELVVTNVSTSDQLWASGLAASASLARSVYALMLLLMSLTVVFGPFLPAYFAGLERLQASGVVGRGVGGVAFGARASGIILNRGGRSLLYAARWLIYLGIGAMVIYFLVVFASDFWDTYLENRQSRY